MITRKIQAAVLTVTLLAPCGTAFAKTRHHKVHHSYAASVARPHHYSQTRGALIGAAAGAAVGRNLKGALIGGALGEAVQYERNKKARKGHY